MPFFLTLTFFNRYKSTNNPEELTSLDEYISRMKDDQDTILYLAGDTQDSILKSPILQKYIKKGYEVLILDDPIDEFTTLMAMTRSPRKRCRNSKKCTNLLPIG